MQALAPLLAELDAWAAVGRQATLWWRDDDATQPTPALEALLAVAAETGVAPVLAVIPFAATAALAERLARAPAVRVWQHGLRHVNRAPAGAKSQELVVAAKEGNRADILHHLAEGRARMQALFGAQFSPALVPPWNRIQSELVPGLAGVGFAALSTFKPRPTPEAAPGLAQLNTHVDVIDWRGGRRFIGDEATASALAAHLRARRLGNVDAAEPTGLLTHHLVMDGRAWGFLRTLFLNTKEHPAALWAPPDFESAVTLP